MSPATSWSFAMYAPSWPAVVAKASCRLQRPSRPVDRALAGAGLMAHVLVSKYADHTPLYRLNQIFARDGVEMAVSTLCDIVGGAAWLLTPLAQAMGRYVLSGSKVHGDDTPIRVLGGPKSKAKTGRLWVYVRDDRPVATPRRRQCGSNTRQIAKASIPGATFDTSRASCKRTRSAGTTGCFMMGESWRPHAGATPGESSTTSTSSSASCPVRWHTRPCSALRQSSTSRPIYKVSSRGANASARASNATGA
jgi:hypothetical protein